MNTQTHTLDERSHDSRHNHCNKNVNRRTIHFIPKLLLKQRPFKINVEVVSTTTIE